MADTIHPLKMIKSEVATGIYEENENWLRNQLSNLFKQDSDQKTRLIEKLLTKLCKASKIKVYEL